MTQNQNFKISPDYFIRSVHIQFMNHHDTSHFPVTSVAMVKSKPRTLFPFQNSNLQEKKFRASLATLWSCPTDFNFQIHDQFLCGHPGSFFGGSFSSLKQTAFLFVLSPSCYPDCREHFCSKITEDTEGSGSTGISSEFTLDTYSKS